jgi:hypothetical protein
MKKNRDDSELCVYACVHACVCVRVCVFYWGLNPVLASTYMLASTLQLNYILSLFSFCFFYFELGTSDSCL